MKKYGILLVLVLLSGSLCAAVSDCEYWETRGDVACAKKNNAGALVSWLRAERVAGVVERVRLVQKRCSLPVEAKKNNVGVFVLEIVKTAVRVFPVMLLQLLTLLSLFLSAYCMRRKGFSVIVRNHFLYVCALIVVCGALFLRKEIDEFVPGVLLKPTVSLMSGPGESFPLVTSLQGPEVVSVGVLSNGHLKISKGSISGWVLADFVEIV